MTLTKEQKLALTRVVAYMDEMYAIASPYYGCTEDANILRAMIDSSEHISDATKMVGFDLERARAEVDTASSRRFSESREQARIFCAEEILPDALDEIERLRAENLELQVAVFGPDGIRANQACIIADQAARISDLEIEIAELKADLEQSERVVEARLDVIDQQAARIKELEANCIYDPETGKVFVPDGHPELEKLRARNRDLEDAHKRSGAKYAKIINELRSSVYANTPGLKKQWDEILNATANGKIGPGDGA